MSNCPSCGGVIGRDCYNPSECAWISERMQEEQRRQEYAEPMEALRVENDRLREALTEARTTLSNTRTNILSDMTVYGNQRWEGVPEKLKERLDEIDAALNPEITPC